MPNAIWTLLAVTTAIAIVQTLVAIVGTIFLWIHARRSSPVAAGVRLPRAVVLMGCKGVEDRLGETLRALASQNYENYRVCVAFDSEHDPAVAFVKHAIAAMKSDKFDLVIAPKAADRSQKIENLLAAIDQAGDWPEVYAFTDSDAVPPSDWLRDMVAPLAYDRVGATTGFRWYARDGSVLGLVRSLWNALGLNWFNTPFVLMCWGGSMAMRRDAFERLNIRSAWQGSISDDLAVATAVRRAGMIIHFVPRCVIPCHEKTTWGTFLRFARRQLLITRICAPDIWLMAIGLMLIFGSAFFTAGLAIAVGLSIGDTRLAMAGGATIAGLTILNMPRALLLHGAVTPLLPPDARRSSSGLLDGLGLVVMVVFNAGLMVSASVSNRINWRGIRYELRSPNETVRLDAVPQESAAPPVMRVAPDVDTQRA